MENIARWLLLSEIPNFGQTAIVRLVNEFGNVNNIFSASEGDILKIKRINKNSVREFINRREDTDLIESYYEKINTLNRQDIQIIPLYEEDYPTLLKKIPDPPASLYIKGNNIQIDRLKTIAIVGSRTATEEGKKNSFDFACKLAREGYVIVSGLALGVDTAAHNGALEAIDGLTIAVVAHGLRDNHIFPPENRVLYYKICDQGFVCTEHPPETKGSKFNFPKRDRIISGLSIATVVIESSLKSGTMITARNAIEQRRQLFVLSTNRNQDKDWFFKLLNMGAQPVSSVEDVLNSLRDEQDRLNYKGQMDLTKFM